MIALLLLAAQAALPSPVPGPVKVSAQDNYTNRCVACHGADGRGRTKRGLELRSPDFTSPRWQQHHTDDGLRQAIARGIPKRKMPAFDTRLSAGEIDELVAYVRAFGRK